MSVSRLFDNSGRKDLPAQCVPGIGVQCGEMQAHLQRLNNRTLKVGVLTPPAELRPTE